MTYLSQIVVIVCLYGMYAISLNLVLGYGGMLSLCQISLVGVGAYIYAGITSWVSLTFIPATALSIIGGVFAAALVAAATSRLRGDYFALSTISLLVFFQFVFLRWTDATGGAFGRRGISPPTIGTLQVNSPQAYALLMVLSLSIVLALCAFLTRGARGRSLKALRDDELAAVSLGYNPIILRTSILLLSGGVAGFAGALLASYTGYIDSTSFSLNEMIMTLAVVVLGGAGKNRGPLFGALFVGFLTEVLRATPLPESVAAGLRQALFGLLLIGLMRFRRAGLLSGYSFD